ncbi:hypothetical protein AtubIFM57258_010561 [Aspergillus tubingensis]|nr:hypothetical protein AtubIFM57258_010561 [Aspergillus tubingensis]
MVGVVLEAGIYASHIIWRIRYRAVRKEAKASGRSIDEVLEERNRVETTQDSTKDGIISHHRGNNSPVQQQQQPSEPKVTQSISEGNVADA